MNQYFKKGSAVFNCDHCNRLTRDTMGDNGRLGLCEDCYSGLESENGAMDSKDSAEQKDYQDGANEAFQLAVNKGGVIEGFTKRHATA